MHIIFTIFFIILTLAVVWWLRMGLHELMHQISAKKYGAAKHDDLNWYDILIFPYWVRISKKIKDLSPRKKAQVMLAGIRSDVVFLAGTFVVWFILKGNQVFYNALLISAFLQTLDMIMNLYFSDYDKLMKMLKKK